MLFRYFRRSEQISHVIFMGNAIDVKLQQGLPPDLFEWFIYFYLLLLVVSANNESRIYKFTSSHHTTYILFGCTF